MVRVESIKPIAAHLPGIKSAIEELLTMKLSVKAKHDAHGSLSYLKSFANVFMSSM